MPERRDMIRAQVTVRGRVQGVWFRGTTAEEARSLGLTGWVRNRPDGTVQALFEGPRDKVALMVGWCYKGPPSARVESVDVRYSDATGEFAGFRVTY